MSKSTLPLTVSNTGFLLDRLGQDCAPLQFVRELTQNAIEAIRRTGAKDGRIVWDVDWIGHERGGGPYRLSITDNGDGMTGPDMVLYINQLSSSGSKQAIDGNYGVGAKIAAATRNHQGLVYLSWKESKGSTIHLWRDPESGQYGLRHFECPDGTYRHYAEVSDDVKPELIKTHGTKIVLLGDDLQQSTMLAPEGVSAKDRWINRYLNTRYFRIPDGITISAREGLQTSKGRERGLIRHVHGQGHFLATCSLNRGVVALRGARAHWWIVKESKDLVTEGPSYETSGHVAALYQDELYEMMTGRSGRALLQQFGVIFATNRVVLYLEPTGELGPLTTNTARTKLIVAGEDLPWAEWAAEFREKIPPEIKRLMEDVAAKSMTDDHGKAVRERLKPLLDLYQVTRYRLSPSGSTRVDEEHTVPGGEPREPGHQRTRNPGGRQGGGGVAGGIYGNFLKNNGAPATGIRPDVFPKVDWVSVAAGTRTPGDIEDRAARYLPEQNRLLINGDFRVFNDLIDRWAAEFQNQAAAREVCRSVIQSWFEQALVEAVIGIQALKESEQWPLSDIHQALSEEGLTMAVMPRYHINFAAKRDVSVRLGKLG